MTSRAAGPTDEERAEFKRGELQAVRDLMCNHDIEAIRQEARDEIKAVIDAELAVASDAPDGFDSGALAAYHHVLAAISSSSATETQDGERLDVLDDPEEQYRRIRAATPTPDDRDREGIDVRTLVYGAIKRDRADLRHAFKQIATIEQQSGSGTVQQALDWLDAAMGETVIVGQPDPDDRDREVERIRERIAPLRNRLYDWLHADHNIDRRTAEALYDDAGLRASGGEE